MRHKPTGQNPTDPIRDIRHIRAIKNMLKANNKPVQYLLFTIGINSGLRVSDLLRLTIGDLWNFERAPRKEFSLRSQKTSTHTVVRVNQAIQEAMQFAAPQYPLYDLDTPLFSVSARTVSRWVKKWCHAVGIDQGIYASHTLRKTFGYQMWLHGGQTLPALMEVSEALGHQDVATTQRYLGITKEAAAKRQLELNL